MKVLRVCLVSPLPSPYGGIAHWTELVTRYAKKQSKVKLTVVDTAPRWRSIHDTGAFKRVIGGGLQMVRDLLTLLYSLITKQIHVVHLTTSGGLAVVRDVGVSLLSLCFRVPLIYHIRFGRIPNISNKNTLEWWLMKFVLLRSSSVIVIDETTHKALRNALPAASVVLVPNCVDLANLSSVERKPTEEKVVLFVGWVVPSKGILELLESWSQINSSGWKLKIVGPGDPEYISLLVSKFRDDSVDFLGELPHDSAMKTMSECNVFVLPSYTEGFPNAVVEAMALGKAIVATDVGAIPEMLADGCGVLVKPRDVDGLVIALSSLMANEHQRVDMGERAGIRVSERFSIETVFASYMSIWHQALGLSE